MKKLIFLLVCLMSMLTGIHADSGKNALRVYRSDGVNSTFLFSLVDSVTYSRTGVDGTANDDFVTQIVWTGGGKSEIPLSIIDSVSFVKQDVVTPGALIDLGLSVKWSSCNVGASCPEDYGCYYVWGETEEKSVYDWNTYKYYDSSSGTCINIGSEISGTNYDVAHVKWGGSWRMPTSVEVEVLVEKCTWTAFTLNGVYGSKVTGPNGNSLFLPAAGSRDGAGVYNSGSYGIYWSGTLDSSEPNLYFAYGLYCFGIYAYWYGSPCYVGFSVRPVSD